MDEKDFDLFLNLAREKGVPQRLYLVFAEKEFATEDEVLTGQASAGSFTIRPVMYTDKPLSKISNFVEMLDESLQNGQHWDIVYVTAGEDRGITAEFVEDRLEHMVKRIEEGEVDLLVAFTQMGDVYRADKAPELH
jgi:hypothetical protein